MTTRSCNTCPALAASRESQNEAFGAAVGSPACTIKLIPIGRPGASEPNIADTIGKNCEDHGKAAIQHGRTSPIGFAVAFPEMDMRPDNPDPTVRSCVSCASYVPPIAVKGKTGWNAAYCRAKGQLLLIDRPTRYARGCQYSKATHSPMSATDPLAARYIEISYFPEYMEGYGRPNPLAHLDNITGEDVPDPKDYPTDRPLTESAKKLGVRALRRIVDPKGYGPNVFLPIFDREALPEVDRPMIPQTGDKEAPELYLDHAGATYKVAVLWTKLDETPAVWGAPGNGKTELFRYFAWMMQAPFTRISISESSEIDDIAGKMLYSPEVGTYFHYGRIPQAWQKANVVVLDEPNTGPPAVWQFVRPLTDNSKQLVLDQNKNELIQQHPCCYLGMAMNPAWDPRNVGAMTLADADGRRLAHIDMPAPPEEVERRILTARLQKDKWDQSKIDPAVNLVLKIARDIRTLSDDGNIPVSWGVAQQIKAVRGLKYFAPVEAYRIAILDSLEPTVRAAVLDAVQSYAP